MRFALSISFFVFNTGTFPILKKKLGIPKYTVRVSLPGPLELAIFGTVDA
jgi:hypothetical protein